jgi:ABC-type sulfate transport system permease component
MNSFRVIIGTLGTILILMVAIPLIRMMLSADPEILRTTVSDQEVLVSIILTMKAAL